jgi:hypothetical protein
MRIVALVCVFSLKIAVLFKKAKIVVLEKEHGSKVDTMRHHTIRFETSVFAIVRTLRACKYYS